MSAPQCPACKAPVYNNDYVICADKSYWHHACYQNAAIAAGLPDPFPSPKAAVPPTLVTRPGPDITEIENQPEPGKAAEGQPLDVPLPLTIKDQPLCHRCRKPVCKSLETIWSHDEQAWTYYHKSCRRKPQPTGKRRSKGTKVEKVNCEDCGKVIGGEPIECKSKAGPMIYFHKKCYRQLFLARGMPDPFAPTAKTVLCAECTPPKQIDRPEFLAHLEEHRKVRAEAQAAAEAAHSDEREPELPFGTSTSPDTPSEQGDQPDVNNDNRTPGVD